MLGLSLSRWVMLALAVVVLSFVVAAILMHIGGGSGPLRTVPYTTP